MKLKINIGKLVTSKFFGTGPSFYKKIIYRAAVSQKLRNTVLDETHSLIHFSNCVRNNEEAGTKRIFLLHRWIKDVNHK